MQLEQFYSTLLKPLVVDSASFKNNHHYKSSIGGQNQPQNKLNRLISELSDLSNSLPIQFTNAIFVRYDTERMDLMKSLIFGSAGTP